MEETISKVSYTYDPVRDLAPVDQFGFVDLRSAFLNGMIPGDLSVNAEDYNGVVDPDSLLPRSSDVFEAYRKAQYVKSADSAGKSEDASASSAGSE